ncbi:transcriptional regulator with XRE-family HTH domain [Luteibacter sp. 621]|uniref:helix-turn-helix transcriptional regulator n=1 Tax=Luteibacter sp. 621 TaxID=3373916 RepID=UPI003D1FB473
MKRTSVHSERHAIVTAYLRELRVVRGLTQGEVAEALDRPQTYVSDIEKNRRGVDMLQVMEFCDAFDVRFEDFAKELMRRIRAKKA